MSRQLLINILCWLMVTTAFANEKKQFIYFSSEGGFSPIRKCEAVIYTDGRVETLFLDYKKHQLRHSFALNKQELAKLKSLIKQVDFFNQPDKDKAVVMDASLVTVIVDSVAGYRKLQFMVRPSMVPLITALYGIAGHAEIIYILNGNNLLDEICQFIGKYGSEKSFLALSKIIAYQPGLQARYVAERAIGDITRRERKAMAQALLNRPVPVKFDILILRNAKRFKQVIVEAVNNHHVTIMHSGGITEISLDELSNSDRKFILTHYRDSSIKNH